MRTGVFGRIYEYFLGEFSKQGAHDNGEFCTPPSIVQAIVNVTPRQTECSRIIGARGI
jgi:type I restriction-modification system DNA methylase subunit